MTGCDRERRSQELDAWLAGLVDLGPGIALAAVGGLGRREQGPRSDLDLVLLHAPEIDLGDLADRIWYPIWDAGYRLDHSVRTPAEARRLAGLDIKVLLGLLDLRLIAGDQELVSELRACVLGDWRGLASKRLGELSQAATERARRFGSVAHSLEPDLKESAGGLRDVTVLRAVAAASLTDVPHSKLAPARELLLDVRDAIHDCGTSGNRLVAQDREAVAQRLGIGSPDDLLRSVAAAGRTIEFAADEVWHRVSLASSQTRWRSVHRRAGRVPIAEGVVVQGDEVVLALDARPEVDPVLLLRAAAAAAQSGRRLSPHAVGRLLVESGELPVPWPADALAEFVTLLDSGPGLVPVWESLDQAGLISKILPQWEHVRSRPQHSPVHIYALDRHLVVTCVQAGLLARRVARPDLLLIASLLHDIGKGSGGDHSVVGAEVASRICDHIGLDSDDRDVVVTLVREHLLLPDTATRRDLDDPTTIAAVHSAVGNSDTLDLLHALTVADAAATGPGAWSDWKAALVSDLVQRVHGALAGRKSPDRPDLGLDLGGSGIEVTIAPASFGWRLTVLADDRVGLLAGVTRVLAAHRLGVHSATSQTVGKRAVAALVVHPLFGDPPGIKQLRQDLRAALSDSKILPIPVPELRGPIVPPSATVASAASERATVIEVRAHDEPGLLHRIALVMAGELVDVVAARVSTFGAEAVDVFYVVDASGEPLSAAAATALCTQLVAALKH